MKDVAEVEKALFLKTTDCEKQDTILSKGRTVQIKYGLNKKTKCPDNVEQSLLLTVCDLLLITTVILVNVVGFWRGLFGILLYLQEMYQLYLLFVLGSLLHFHFTLSRRAYKRHLEKKTVCNFVLRKIYTYVFGSACVIQWAGLWYILDAMSGLEIIPPLIYSIICSAILLCFKLFRNVLAPPCSLAIDRMDQFFEFQTVFKTTLSKKGSSEVSLYVLDCFFSVFVVGSLVVFVWRGVWCLTDIYLFPENESLSAYGSLAIGYGIVIVIFSLQTPMERLCDKLTGFWRILIADIYVFVSFIGTINLWRGFWNLLNIYFLPESPVLSCWITHLGSFILLVLIKCSNSVLVRGVYLDGEGGGQCVVFPTLYLRLIFQERRRKEFEKNQVNHKISSSNVSTDVEKPPKETVENSKSPKVQSTDSCPEVNQQNSINVNV